MPSTCTTASSGSIRSAHLLDHDAVDLDPAGLDQLLGLAPGGDAGGGQHLLQPDAVRTVLLVVDVRGAWTRRGRGRPGPDRGLRPGLARFLGGVVLRQTSSIPSISGSSGPSEGNSERSDKTKSLKKQVGGAVQQAAGVRVGADVLDESPGHQGADDTVDVDPADPGDPGPGDRLPVGDDGQRFQRRPGQPALRAVEHEPFDDRREPVAGVEPPAAAEFAQFDAR